MSNGRDVRPLVKYLLQFRKIELKIQQQQRQEKKK